jgi:hypothetical protein
LLAQDQDQSWRQVPVSRQAGRQAGVSRRCWEYQVSERWGMVEVVGELELELELELERAVGAQPSLQSVVEKRAVQVGAHASRAGFSKPVCPVKSPAP